MDLLVGSAQGSGKHTCRSKERRRPTAISAHWLLNLWQGRKHALLECAGNLKPGHLDRHLGIAVEGLQLSCHNVGVYIYTRQILWLWISTEQYVCVYTYIHIRKIRWFLNLGNLVNVSEPATEESGSDESCGGVMLGA